jgi:hypothetical protein
MIGFGGFYAQDMVSNELVVAPEGNSRRFLFCFDNCHYQGSGNAIIWKSRKLISIFGHADPIDSRFKG